MNLFIVWNSFSILEFLCSVENYNDYFILIDLNYNKNNKENILDLVQKFISIGIFKGIIEEKDIINKHFEAVALMSYINDYNLNLLERISFNKLILLEEGLYDYIINKEDANFFYYNQSSFYVNNIKDILNKKYFKEIIEINYKEDILNLYMRVLNFKDYLKKNIDLILFTSPLKEDYNLNNYIEKIKSYLDKNYQNKNILIKKHPRDISLYDSSNYKSIYIDSLIPGQIINNFYKCEKLYIHPSTVILSEKDVSKTTILKFNDLKNRQYLDFFNYNKIKECKIVEI